MNDRVVKAGTRLRIGYGDQNEEFAQYLPRVGIVEGAFLDINGEGPWFFLRLEDPFEYQLKIAEPFQYRLARIDAFLIRSRWVGCEIGDSEGVSVFLLLVERDRHPEGREVNPMEFIHIAWGMCRPEAS